MNIFMMKMVLLCCLFCIAVIAGAQDISAQWAGRTVCVMSVAKPNQYIYPSANAVRFSALMNREMIDAASFRIVSGLADKKWVSFESVLKPGYYLRNRGRVFLDQFENADNFKQEATFSIQRGLTDDAVQNIIPYNARYCRLRQRENMLVTSGTNEPGYAIDSAFILELAAGIVPLRTFEIMGKYMAPLPGKEVAIESYARQGMRFAAFGDNTAVVIGTKEQGACHEWFKVVPGLADSSALSFESVSKPGYFLRHWAWAFSLDKFYDDDTFRVTSTFLVKPGFSGENWCALRAYNHPEHYLRVWDKRAVLNKSADNPDTFLNEATIRFVSKDGGFIRLPDAAVPVISDPYSTPGQVVKFLRGKEIIIESVARSGYVLQLINNQTRVTAASAGKSVPGEKFRIVAGLADKTQVSFESVTRPGHFLRHWAWVFSVDKKEENDAFAMTSTFFVVPGLNDNKTYSIRAYNEIEHYLRIKGTEVLLNKDGDVDFAKEITLRFIEAGKSVAFTASPADDNTPRGGQKGNPPPIENYWMKWLMGRNVKIGTALSKDKYITSYGNDANITVNTVGNGAAHDTYRVIAGLIDKSHLSFESISNPGYFLSCNNGKLCLLKSTNEQDFQLSSTFVICPGFADKALFSMRPQVIYDKYMRLSGKEIVFNKKTENPDNFAAESTFFFANPDGSALKLPDPDKEDESGVNPAFSINPALGKIICIESYANPGNVIKLINGDNRVTATAFSDDNPGESFKVVPGLADAAQLSFESVSRPGHYLRHWGFVFLCEKFANVDSYLKTSTFKITPGLADNNLHSISAVNEKNYYMRFSGHNVSLNPNIADDPAFPTEATVIFFEPGNFKKRQSFRYPNDFKRQE
jgi:hypothetical protein